MNTSRDNTKDSIKASSENIAEEKTRQRKYSFSPSRLGHQERYSQMNALLAAKHGGLYNGLNYPHGNLAAYGGPHALSGHLGQYGQYNFHIISEINGRDIVN
jgi:hypothetical protein